MILSQNVSELRQELPISYYPNGAIYIFSKNKFLKEKAIPSRNILPYCKDEMHSIDIDTKLDLKFAKFLVSK